ncbi:MAG: stalk domain-containing protein [Fimbriimonadales bacterium]|nr:stalk domain-containing protein [Fimbriimonadales bacterium]
MDNRKRLWSLLALTGLSSTAIATWQPQSPLQVLKGEPNRLTVQLRGVQPAVVEVVVDGMVIATRHLTGRTDRVQLDLQNIGLAPGVHEATIRLYDAQGRLIAQRATRIELAPDPNSPLTIVAPRNGSRVAGVVPIEVRVNHSGAAYVSFFIDGQVRGLRNYPPYIYNWDTARETNGWHTIEVWSHADNQTFRTPPMRVFVNNPGGRTERQMPPAEVVGEPAVVVTETAPTASVGAMRSTDAPETRLSDSPRLSAPAAPAPEPAEPSVQLAVADLPPNGSRDAVAQAQPSPSRVRTPAEEPHTGVAASTPMQVNGQPRALHAEPQMRGQKLRAPQIALAPAAPMPKAPTNAPRTRLEHGAHLTVNTTHFAVVLNGVLLDFDVAPRAEDGVPLIPVRRVLEPLGARLRWDNQGKVAYAELGVRSIALRVRENQILIDGAPVPVDAPLRIVHGRVLVPAPALRDMLNAEVAFDEAKGQVVVRTSRE